eukprot:2728-Heterococcus_DN1.PRE.4
MSEWCGVLLQMLHVSLLSTRSLSRSLINTHYNIEKQCTNVSSPHALLLLSLLAYCVALYVHISADTATATAT